MKILKVLIEVENWRGDSEFIEIPKDSKELISSLNKVRVTRTKRSGIAVKP